jgi:hypothetical protein
VSRRPWAAGRWLALVLGAACGPPPGAPGGDAGVVTFGQRYEGGQFNLGPVDWAESKWHNACAPAGGYPAAVQQLEGDLLAGLWNGLPQVAAWCDACIEVTTAKGKSAMLRVVTYGGTSTNSIDVSPQAFTRLDSGEYPRAMTWQLARCPDTGAMRYEFQTGASQGWTSLWVRNPRLAVAKLEVQSPNHPAFTALARGSDGTLTDGAGFGKGPFTLRATSVDGQQVQDTFDWPAAGIAGQLLTGHVNFQ